MDGISLGRHPKRQFLLIPRVRDDSAVGFHSIGFCFDKGGASSPSCPRNGFANALANLQHGIAIADVPGNGVRLGTRRNILCARALHDGSGRGIAVVLAEKDHGQLPQRRKIQAFGENTLIGGAIAEKADGHLVCSPSLRGKSGAKRDAHATADDAIASQKPLLFAELMHGSTKAAGQPCFPPHHLGHGPRQISHFGDAVTMRTVRAGSKIIIAQRAAGAHGHRLLPDVQMNGARDLLGSVEAFDLLLEPTDLDHLSKHLGLLTGCCFIHRASVLRLHKAEPRMDTNTHE